MGTVRTKKILAVNEIFGPTFQGEGPGLGRPVMFLRLAGCNLACKWCDSRYAWDWFSHDSKVEMHARFVDDIADELKKQSVRTLVISGGEPMLQEPGLQALKDYMQGWWFEIETAGTIAPQVPHIFDRFNVSIKLSNSGNKLEKRIKPEAIQELKATRRAIWKFVVNGIDDLLEVDLTVDEFGLDKENVYIMPQGIGKYQLLLKTVQIANQVIQRGYNLTTRLQVLTYGNKRAV